MYLLGTGRFYPAWLGALSIALTSAVAKLGCRGSHMLGLTFGVINGVHMPVDIALQVGVELGGRWEEGQADGHELPATGQALQAEVLCGLPA